MSRDTSKYSPYSLGTRPRQDYTHRVMLNNCVSAHWSPMYQYLALTSLRDSHPLQSRTFVNQVTDRLLFFSLLYFRFRTSISISAFPTCPFRYRSFAPICSPRITAPPSISNRQLCIFHTVGSVCTPPFQNLRAIETQNHSYSMVLPTATG